MNFSKVFSLAWIIKLVSDLQGYIPQEEETSRKILTSGHCLFNQKPLFFAVKYTHKHTDA